MADPIHVQVPGLGLLEFPAGMSQADMQQAIDALRAQQSPAVSPGAPSPASTPSVGGVLSDLGTNALTAARGLWDATTAQQQAHPVLSALLPGSAALVPMLKGFAKNAAQEGQQAYGAATQAVSDPLFSGQQLGDTLSAVSHAGSMAVPGAASAGNELGGGGDVNQGLADAASIILPLLVTEGVGAAAQGAARGLVKSAFKFPQALAAKYGADAMTDAAMADQVGPTMAGSAQAKSLLDALQGQKAYGLAASDDTAIALPSTIRNRAYDQVWPQALAEHQAGLRPTSMVPSVIDDFANTNRWGIRASNLDQAVGKWNNALGNATVARQLTGAPMDLDEQAYSALAREGNQTLDALAPGTTDLNRRIMTMEGLRQAALKRALIPARGIDSIAATYGPAAELAAGQPVPAAALAATRLARRPGLMAGAGFGLNSAGQAITADPFRAALLMQLQSQAQNGGGP